MSANSTSPLDLFEIISNVVRFYIEQNVLTTWGLTINDGKLGRLLLVSKLWRDATIPFIWRVNGDLNHLMKILYDGHFHFREWNF